MFKLFIVLSSYLLFFSYSLNAQVSSKQLKDPAYTQTKSDEAKKLFDRGFMAYRQKKLSIAVQLYRQALKQDSLFAIVLDNLAMTYSVMRRQDSASYFFNKSIKVYPQGAFARVSLASLFLGQHKTAEAIRLSADAIRLDPDFTEAHFILAGALLAANEPKLALPYALKSIELSQQGYTSEFYGQTLYRAAMCFYLMKNMTHAKGLFERADKYGMPTPNEIKAKL